MKRSFLMLAHKFDEKKHRIGGWYCSEKLDGIRAFWDGGISRRMPCTQVPWANTDKDYRLKNEQISTGLWSRYGHVIYAPDEWLDQLPDFALDGELYSESGWQEASSIIKRHDKSGDWTRIKYYIFDSPSLASVFADGRIDEINYKKNFLNIEDWLRDHGVEIRDPKMFEYSYKYLRDHVDWTDNCVLHEQVRLSINNDKAKEEMEYMMDDVIKRNGEGLILRENHNIWVPERSKEMLKVKRYLDSEGTVVGYTWGLGKYQGMMGNVILNFKGQRLEMSGFTDTERRMSGTGIGKENIIDGKVVDGKVVDTESNWSEIFPIGSIITFKYRELSDSMIPKEASYLRKK